MHANRLYLLSAILLASPLMVGCQTNDQHLGNIPMVEMDLPWQVAPAGQAYYSSTTTTAPTVTTRTMPQPQSSALSQPIVVNHEPTYYSEPFPRASRMIRTAPFNPFTWGRRSSM